MKYEYYVDVEYIDGRVGPVGFFTYVRAENFASIAKEYCWELGIKEVGAIRKA